MSVKLRDLRNHKNFRIGAGESFIAGMVSKTYTLKDINYATGSPNIDSKYNDLAVTKMMIQEFQPQYPIYTQELGEAGSTLIKTLSQKVLSFFNRSLGGVVASTAKQTVTAAGTVTANSLVDSLSENPSKLYNRSTDSATSWYSNLFRVDNLGAYEVPFFSDYMWEADGIGGWSTGDATRQLGATATKMLEGSAKVNYPTTPNWEYKPSYPNVDFKFHLINDTSKNLQKNIKFLIAFTSGMLWVQTGHTGIGGGGFKSPNVYSVVVPGRFRWMWSALSINCKAVGKIFKDAEAEKLGDIKAFTGLSAGFPEAIEISVTVKSLIPNNFNTFIDYMIYGNSDVTRKKDRLTTQAALKELKDIGKKIASIGKK